MESQFNEIGAFNQYEGKFPLLQPDYANKQYITHFEKLKTLISQQQFSSRANRLANIVISNMPSNYNAWQVKRRCLQKGVTTIEEQLKFTQEILTENIKNFQGWEFRRHLVELRGSAEGQYEFLEKTLEEDHKNYHLWTYRIWLSNHFDRHQEQLKRVEGWIDIDVMNNTAWTYKKHLLNKMAPNLTKQLQYVMDKIMLNIDNEAAWNYLRGWFPSIRLNPYKPGQQTHKYVDNPQILKFCLKLIQDNARDTLIQPYITLVNIYSQDDKVMARGICELLVQRHPQKANYWNWVILNL